MQALGPGGQPKIVRWPQRFRAFPSGRAARTPRIAPQNIMDHRVTVAPVQRVKDIARNFEFSIRGDTAATAFGLVFYAKCT